MIAADAHAGLRAAAARVFNATPQRCRVHWMRNAFAYAHTKQRPAVSALLRTIFMQEAADDVSRLWRQVTDQLRDGFPKLAEFMERTETDVLVYMGFPREHWTQISSTNPIARVNREIKRRCDVIGIFPNDAAIIRLVGALMFEQNDEWTVCRHYMTLEGLAAIIPLSACPPWPPDNLEPVGDRCSCTTLRGTVRIRVNIPLWSDHHHR
ncbi:transposase [Komagataeibacter nataicola NRIC 0616]|nr:transposase [Komagataeibacter nataicola NRIC 0616]